MGERRVVDGSIWTQTEQIYYAISKEETRKRKRKEISGLLMREIFRVGGLCLAGRTVEFGPAGIPVFQLSVQ